MIFRDDIQSIGDALGLGGTFLVDYGFHQILEKIKRLKEDKD